MPAHNFQLVIKNKPKVKFLSGYDPSKQKIKYHCKNCDSTVEYDKPVGIHELNQHMSNPDQKFPCISVKQ